MKHVCTVCRTLQAGCVENLSGRPICPGCLERAGQLTLGAVHPLDSGPKAPPKRRHGSPAQPRRLRSRRRDHGPGDAPGHGRADAC